jgi:hypothetical protein
VGAKKIVVERDNECDAVGIPVGMRGVLEVRCLEQGCGFAGRGGVPLQAKGTGDALHNALAV